MDYTQFVHEFEHIDGNTRYAVGRWDQEHGQYTVPHDNTTRELTGCFASFAKKPFGLPDHYSDRRKALRRARYLFGELQEDE